MTPKAIGAGAMGFLSFLAGDTMTVYLILLLFMLIVIDTVTGITRAAIEKKISSDMSFSKAVVKLIGYLTLIALIRIIVLIFSIIGFTGLFMQGVALGLIGITVAISAVYNVKQIFIAKKIKVGPIFGFIFDTLACAQNKIVPKKAGDKDEKEAV